MNILNDLWYGNIDPQAREIKEGSPVKKALTLVGKHDEVLRTMLSDTQKEQYDKLSDSQVRLTDLLEREAFAEGFCLAARLMIAVMNTMETPPRHWLKNWDAVDKENIISKRRCRRKIGRGRRSSTYMYEEEIQTSKDFVIHGSPFPSSTDK